LTIGPDQVSSLRQSLTGFDEYPSRPAAVCEPIVSPDRVAETLHLQAAVHIDFRGERRILKTWYAQGESKPLFPRERAGTREKNVYRRPASFA